MGRKRGNRDLLVIAREVFEELPGRIAQRLEERDAVIQRKKALAEDSSSELSKPGMTEFGAALTEGVSK